MRSLTHRNKMELLEESILNSGAMIELECKHYFAHGTYTRELYLPKHTVLTGRIHLNSTINIITKGKIKAISEEGEYDIEAPYTFVSGAMVKKAGFTLEDTIWINVFPWDGEEEPDMVLDKLTVPTYKMLEAL